MTRKSLSVGLTLLVVIRIYAPYQVFRRASVHAHEEDGLVLVPDDEEGEGAVALEQLGAADDPTRRVGVALQLRRETSLVNHYHGFLKDGAHACFGYSAFSFSSLSYTFSSSFCSSYSSAYSIFFLTVYVDVRGQVSVLGEEVANIQAPESLCERGQREVWQREHTYTNIGR